VYCLPECAWEREWVESFDRYEPDAEENIRNVTPVYITPPAPVKVWEAEGYDSLMQEMQMVKARNIRQHDEIERLKAAHRQLTDVNSWVNLSQEDINYFQTVHCVYPGTLLKIQDLIKELNT
jgi:hypothetical protein